ncbi:MAG: hypothetical protein HQL56_10635 [Magnetococcales bacterium]|nr:hypothetical protein [Magnetococcales bacterium]
MGEGNTTCWHCHHILEVSEFGRGSTCSACGRSNRACRNCHFFDESLYNGCRENRAERVVDKETGNFCDFFRPGRGSTKPSTPDQSARSLAESLFGKK